MSQLQLSRWILLSMTSLAVACTSDHKTSNIFSPDAGNSPKLQPGDAASVPDAGIENDAGIDTSMPAPSIVGSYEDNFGDPISITASTWIIGTAGDASSVPSVFHLVQVDNTNSFAIAQNDAVYSYIPDKWSRFDWAIGSDHVLRFCQTAYAADSAEQALQTPAANAQDFDHGCGGFSWSKLTPAQT